MDIEQLPQKEIQEFCLKWQIKKLFVFGSILRSDFDPQKSDIDILADFAADAPWSLFDHFYMKEELENIFRRPVDFLTLHALNKSENHIRQHEILSTAKAIYESAA